MGASHPWSSMVVVVYGNLLRSLLLQEALSDWDSNGQSTLGGSRKGRTLFSLLEYNRESPSPDERQTSRLFLPPWHCPSWPPSPLQHPSCLAKHKDLFLLLLLLSHDVIRLRLHMDSSKRRHASWDKIVDGLTSMAVLQGLAPCLLSRKHQVVAQASVSLHCHASSSSGRCVSAGRDPLRAFSALLTHDAPIIQMSVQLRSLLPRQAPTSHGNPSRHPPAVSPPAASPHPPSASWALWTALPRPVQSSGPRSQNQATATPAVAATAAATPVAVTAVAKTTA